MQKSKETNSINLHGRNHRKYHQANSKLTDAHFCMNVFFSALVFSKYKFLRVEINSNKRKRRRRKNTEKNYSSSKSKESRKTPQFVHMGSNNLY